MRLDPNKRPRAVEIRERSAEGAAPAEASVRPLHLSEPAASGRGTPAPFLGREQVLARLEEAFRESRKGAGTTVLLEGDSGLGKTALLRQAVARLANEPTIVILAGRCFERESVPYKAFDELIDSLAHFLLWLPDVDQSTFVPRDAFALARLFPVLARVPAIADAPRRMEEGADVHQVRRAAFGALRDLLARLAERRRVVLIIDDLQWADPDSVSLLRALTAPPDAPSVLLVLAYRTEDVAKGAPLAALLAPTSELVALSTTRRITLRALSREDARRLALALFREAAPADASHEALASHIAVESGGSPFFIGELVRWALSVGMSVGAGLSIADVRVATVVRDRVRALSAEARVLLEVVALAGRPITLAVAFRAAALEGESRLASLSALQDVSLVRGAGARAEDVVECFHDHIRETVAEDLEAGLARRLHGALARALVETGTADPEDLYLHYAAADPPDHATSHAIAAAAKSSSALAFDRAAHFYRAALELLPKTDDRVHRLRIELGDALANAGRGAEAADAYLLATEGANDAERLALQRRAAEELLFTGHLDRGCDVMSQVLAHFGTGLAKTRLQAVVTLLFWRLWLLVRGIGHTERDASSVAETDLARLDVFASTAVGLSTADTVLAAPFSSRHLAAALHYGEPHRICRALCLEVSVIAVEGRRSKSTVERYLARAFALADQVQRPDTRALVVCTTGLCHHFLGHWRLAVESFEQGLAIYRDEAMTSSGGARSLSSQNFTMRWEMNAFSSFLLSALVQRGLIGALEGRLATFLRDADERGDLYILTNMHIGDANVGYLARGDVETARGVVDEAMVRWSRRGFQVQHWWALQAYSLADLYEGRGASALARLSEQWPLLRRSLLLQVQFLRLRAHLIRARAHLAVALEASNERAAQLASARRDARRVLREGMTWSTPEAELLLGCAARIGGDDGEARRRFESALEGFDRSEMGLLASVTRRRLGEIVGGDEGRAAIRAADDAMNGEAVRDPAAVTRMFAPM